MLRRRRRPGGMLVGAGGAAPPYAAVSVLGDGTADSATRTGGMVGGVADKRVTFNGWVKSTGTNTKIVHGKAQLGLSSDGRPIFFAQASASTTLVLNATLSAGAYADGEWHHVLASFELGNTDNRWCRVDDAATTLSVTTYTDANIGFDHATDWYIAKNNIGTQRYAGDLADVEIWQGLFLANAEASWRQFITADGTPVNPASRTSLGSRLIGLTGAVATWHENTAGIGGAFTLDDGAEFVAGDLPVELGS